MSNKKKKWIAWITALVCTVVCCIGGLLLHRTHSADAYVSQPEYIINDSTERSGTAVVNRVSDFAQWTVPGPFNTGDSFQLDFDTKGSEEMQVYFWGHGNYRQVSNIYNVTTDEMGAEGATDGRTHIYLTPDYKHYTIRFRLGSTGDANEDKYVMFRCMSGCSATIKNVKFRTYEKTSLKYDKKFVGWNTKTDGTGTWYQEGDNIKSGTLKSDMDLYAQWADASYDFGYTGEVQTFKAPFDGTYKLEVWGASGGGDSTYTGGKGGYSYGEIKLKKDQPIYVTVGQAGSYVTGAWASTPATFNGGGKGVAWQGSDSAAGSGGGATSIQLTQQGDGQLKNYFSDQNDVLIVAGGGGAGSHCNGSNWGAGGYGGGESGGNAVRMNSRGWNVGGSTIGGSQSKQTNGGNFGSGDYHIYSNGDNRWDAFVGGGGGWYGGVSSDIQGAGGGSGHVSSALTNAKTIAGNTEFEEPWAETATGHTGNGYARITLVKTGR